jgi:hypothetical protein
MIAATQTEIGNANGSAAPGRQIGGWNWSPFAGDL